MRKKALAKWQDTEATAGRNQVRAWMNSRKHISENALLDGTYQKLWAYLVTEIEEFPESDSSKNYSDIDSMTASGRSRKGPVVGQKKKNAKDLVRVGLSPKDALDFIQDEYGVNDAVLVGWQVIGQIMAIYLMFKCGNLYIMVHVRDDFIPDNMTELGMISTQIKIWNDLRATVEQGLSPVVEAMASGKSPGDKHCWYYWYRVH
ncbi:MAG: hypothetical protein BYD32DRAFT_467589 [Podila humilis]|nr:MAG: hypothetical protein BYD32DRAFT_467589 [Podila humilis]